ncbi:MAG: dihydrofolate reductase [Planctomycetota bacterium]
MILISAMTEDRVIGAGDGMPWDVPEEYQQFLDLVAGQTIFMGRKSYEIFGPDLTTDHTVVLTRRGGVAGGAVAAASLDEAIDVARSFGKTVFCGGGASVYEQAMPRADAMYLSTIKGDYEGDTHFPEFSLGDWRVVEDRDHERFRFVRYERG